MSGKPTDIDELYGLEPVIVLSQDAGSDGVEPFVDCQVCCQPIQISVQVDEGGRLVSALGERMDR